MEDIDYRSARGLDRTLMQKLAEGQWIKDHENLIICGPTGVGKSFLASALGHKACRDNLPSSISAFRASSPTWPLPEATDVIAVSCARSVASNCLCLTILASSPSTLPLAMIFSRSSKNDTAAVQQLLRVN